MKNLKAFAADTSGVASLEAALCLGAIGVPAIYAATSLAPVLMTWLTVQTDNLDTSRELLTAMQSCSI